MYLLNLNIYPYPLGLAAKIGLTKHKVEVMSQSVSQRLEKVSDYKVEARVKSLEVRSIGYI